MDFAIRQFAHLRVGDLRPVAGHHAVHALEAVGQVHHDLVELRRCTALQEQDFVIGRDAHELAQILFGVVQDAGEHVGAVAHRHHGKAGAVVIEHFALGGA